MARLFRITNQECAETVQLTLFFGIEANKKYSERRADKGDNRTTGESDGGEGERDKTAVGGPPRRCQLSWDRVVGRSTNGLHLHEVSGARVRNTVYIQIKTYRKLIRAETLTNGVVERCLDCSGGRY